LTRIAQEPFWACEKTDGTRYLLFVPGVDPTTPIVKVSEAVGEEANGVPIVIGERFGIEVPVQSSEKSGVDSSGSSRESTQPTSKGPSEFLKHRAYFIDREFQVYECPILLSVSMVDDAMRVQDLADGSTTGAKATELQILAARSRFSALFDGEVVTDSIPTLSEAKAQQPHSGQSASTSAATTADPTKRVSFYVFDCLYYGQHRLLREKFSTRMKFGNLLVRLAKFDSTALPTSLGIHFHTKAFFHTTEVRALFGLIHEKRLPHSCDGVVFTSEDDPYTFGTTKSLQKWKPIEQNTIDCQIEIGTQQVILVTEEELATMTSVGDIWKHCGDDYIRQVRASRAAAVRQGAHQGVHQNSPPPAVPPVPPPLLQAAQRASALFRELNRRPPTTVYFGALHIASAGQVESSPIDIIYFDERKYNGLLARRDGKPVQRHVVAKGPKSIVPSRSAGIGRGASSGKPMIIEITWNKAKPGKKYDGIDAILREAERKYYEYSTGGVVPPPDQRVFNFQSCRYPYKIEKAVMGGWATVGKIREDKRLPNDRATYESVCRSYDEHVEWNDLCLMLEGKLPLPSGLPAGFKSPFAFYKRPGQDEEDQEEERKNERKQAGRDQKGYDYGDGIDENMEYED